MHSGTNNLRDWKMSGGGGGNRLQCLSHLVTILNRTFIYSVLIARYRVFGRKVAFPLKLSCDVSIFPLFHARDRFRFRRSLFPSHYTAILFVRIRLLFPSLLFWESRRGIFCRTGKIEETVSGPCDPLVYHRDCLVSIICRKRGCDSPMALLSSLQSTFVLLSFFSVYVYLFSWIRRYFSNIHFPGKCSRHRRVVFKDTK